MSGPVFGAFFVGHSFPITNANFVQADPTHWVLDVTTTVVPDYRQLKEIALFLVQPNVIAPELAFGLYVSVGSGGWAYRGLISNNHPSEVLPLQWPAQDEAPQGPGYAQIGIALEPYSELVQKEGSKLGAREEYAKRVAMDLFRFMESFNVAVGADQLVVPTNVLDRWFTKFSEKFRRDPDFLTRDLEKA